VLIRVADWERIRSGEVTLQFRRWKRPTVRAGGTLRTSLGVLAIDAVDVVTRASRAEALAAGFTSVRELMSSVDGREGSLYRIRLRFVGEDPRIALRSSSDVDGLELSDAGVALLRLIAANPGVRAADLAASVGREKLPFKADVRKLKAKGLTESLEVGYRLSPRGEAYLRSLDAQP
jgi:predicted transcriptional regulator